MQNKTILEISEDLGIELSKSAKHKIYKGCHKRFNYPNDVCMCQECLLQRYSIIFQTQRRMNDDYFKINDVTNEFILRYITYSDGRLIENIEYIRRVIMQICIVNFIHTNTRLSEDSSVMKGGALTMFIEELPPLKELLSIRYIGSSYNIYILEPLEGIQIDSIPQTITKHLVEFCNIK